MSVVRGEGRGSGGRRRRRRRRAPTRSLGALALTSARLASRTWSASRLLLLLVHLWDRGFGPTRLWRLYYHLFRVHLFCLPLQDTRKQALYLIDLQC